MDGMGRISIGVIGVTVGLLSGCASDFSAVSEVPEDCDRQRFFVDEDGDGWGGPDAESIYACEPEGEFTSVNNFDCDDSDPGITGEYVNMAEGEKATGAKCPGAKAEGSVVGFPLNGREVFAVKDTSINGGDGLDASLWKGRCSDWGGRLLQLVEGDWSELEKLEVAGDNRYVAIIHYQSDGSTMRWGDAGSASEALPNSTWSVTERECDVPDAGKTLAEYLAPNLYGAVVYENVDGNYQWCIGSPNAYTDGPIVAKGLAMCERETRAPSEFPYIEPAP